MKKKILALLMCCVMLMCLLEGCGDSTKTSDAEGENAGAAEVIDTKFPEGTEIVMAICGWTGSPVGLERVNARINEYTEAEYGITVELMITDIAAYGESMNLMLASDEQVDIFNAIALGFTSCVNKGYCLNLEENDLIQTYGPEILEILDEGFVDACRVSGALYGLPQQRDMANATDAFIIPVKYLDAIGFDYNSMYKEGDEVIYTNLDVINDIYEQLHEAYPEMEVIAPAIATLEAQGPIFDPIGGDSFGVLLDPGNSLTIENLYESDVFREWVERYYEWNQLGYISKDAAIDDTAPNAKITAGTCLSMQNTAKPGIRLEASALCGMEVIVFQCGESFAGSSYPNTMPWCINQSCENPEAAMTILNAFYTVPYLSNLLCWGEEDVDWKYAEDGEHITFADGVTAENSEYYNNVNFELPNQFIAEIWEGQDLDIWERMEKFNADAIISKAMGFTFDQSNVMAEYTALNNVYNEYVKSLFFGFVEPEQGIAELNEALYAAGLEEYMAEKQTQIDAWRVEAGME